MHIAGTPKGAVRVLHEPCRMPFSRLARASGWLRHPKRVLRFAREIRSTPYPRLAYIAGWLGHENLGDEILRDAIGKLFNPFSVIPFEAARSVNCINRWTHSVLGGILAGGTVINGGEAFLAPLHSAIRFLPTVFVFGSGVCDPGFWQAREGRPDGRAQWRDALKRCEFVGVRGPASSRLLADVGISAEVVGDPALAFFDESLALAHEGLQVCLGLNIGQSYGRVWGSEERIISQYIILARKARQMGWRVTWFVVWPEDLEVAKHAARESSTSEDIFLEYHSAERYLDKVRGMTLFVGMKLHAVVLATCACVPSLMVEYRPKCRDYMESINQEDSNIRSDLFEGDEALKILQSWLEMRGHRQAQLRIEVSALAARQRQRSREIACRILKKNQAV